MIGISGKRTRLMTLGGALAVLALLVGCSSSGSSGGAKSSGPFSLTVAYQGNIAAFAPEMLIANDPSMCNQFNVNVKMTPLDPATAQAALVAGQIQALVQGSGSSLQGAYKNPCSLKRAGGESA
jgi:hypothetical protein